VSKVNVFLYSALHVIVCNALPLPDLL